MTARYAGVLSRKIRNRVITWFPFKGGNNGETVLLHHIFHKEIHASLGGLSWRVITPHLTSCGFTSVYTINQVRKRPPYFLSCRENAVKTSGPCWQLAQFLIICLTP